MRDELWWTDVRATPTQAAKNRINSRKYHRRKVMIHELASIIHEQRCDRAATANEWTCPVFKHGHEHFEHFMSQAAELFDKLEPEIGSGNVIPVVRIMLAVFK
jgi:hypothetical protein